MSGIAASRWRRPPTGSRVEDGTRPSHIRVATKYPEITRRHFAARGIQAECIKLNGAIELAPRLGLCRHIVDLVQTGATLKANGLVEIERIAEVSSRLIVNRPALKTRPEEVGGWIERFRAAVDEKRRCRLGPVDPRPRLRGGLRAAGRRQPRDSPPMSMPRSRRSSRTSPAAATRRCSTTPAASTGSTCGAPACACRRGKSPRALPPRRPRRSRHCGSPPSASRAFTAANCRPRSIMSTRSGCGSPRAGARLTRSGSMCRAAPRPIRPRC